MGYNFDNNYTVYGSDIGGGDSLKRNTKPKSKLKRQEAMQ